MEEIITVKASFFIGKDIRGLRAQVRNPKYISELQPPKWRTLTGIKTFKEHGKEWLVYTWVGEGDDSCNYSGCTIESDSCQIQLKKSDFERYQKQLF